MLVVMKAHASDEQVEAVCSKVESLGYKAHSMPGAQRVAIGITGNQGTIDPGSIEEMPGVGEVISVSKPYKLVSRDVKEDDTVLRLPRLPDNDSEAVIGGTQLEVIAGPCGVEG